MAYSDPLSNEKKVLYEHPVHGMGWLISTTTRRGEPAGFTFLTLAGERFVACGSDEEREWQPKNGS
jgi:hypothetical protein